MKYRTSNTLLMLARDKSNEAAWQTFSETYTPFFYSIIKSFHISHEDSQELAQDVILKVWNHLDTFLYDRSRCKFRTWVTRIVKNTAINFVNKKSSRETKKNVSIDSESFLDLSQDSETDLLAEKEWKLFIANKAWESLQGNVDQNKLAVYLYCIEGHSAAQAAEKYGIKENSAFRYRKVVQNLMATEVKRLNEELDA